MNTSEFYDNQCRQYKENWKASHWISKESQEDNFELLTQIAPFEKSDRILDLGCGCGDLYGFMQKRGVKTTYEGIDNSQEMINRCWQKYPTGRFACIDFMNARFEYKYDWILASGPFNHKTENQYQYLEDNIKKAYRLARKGVGMTIMSQYDPAQKISPCDYLFGYDPVEVTKLCFNLTPFINLNHTALPWGFVLFLYNSNWITT